MRTYSEHEVSAIIERAVERQQAAEAGDGTTGLTLDEIERLGREAGIDPAHLRAAAEEVDVAGRTLTRQRSQTRTQVVVERWIDAPVTSAGWEDVVTLLRERFGPHAGALLASDVGESVQQIGETYEWSHTSPLGVRTRVAVSPRSGRTRLRMTQLVGLSSPAVEGVGYGAAIASVVAFVVLLVFGAQDVATATTLASMALAFVLSWAAAAPLVTVADRRWRARKLRELDDLADDLAPILSVPARDAEGAPAPVPDEAPEPAGRLDLDALADETTGPDAPHRTAQRIR